MTLLEINSESNYSDVKVNLNDFSKVLSSEELLVPVAFDQIFRIKKRTESGVDANDSFFAPYSPKYRAFKSRHGHPVQRVDLFFSGRMQSAMDVEILNQNSVRIFFNDARQSLKAVRHNLGFGGTPKREFFKISKSDEREIEKTVNILLNKAIEDLDL